ncbi:MAG: ABC transporter ATP-binding protein [Ruminococcaceae bacterium]|nr:ABC transporter ATP-binding protein [Oscillospiraceae bacterium]
MNQATYAIEIQGLSKRFGTIQAVDRVSFSVKRGELFAFLGVNGAGKSTTIAMLCGQLKKDSGEILIGGVSPTTHGEQIKRSLGVVFQQSVLDRALTVRDNLESRAALYGIYGKELARRLTELSELLELDSLLSRPLGKLSGGQQRRIDIARALIHRPQILILDEPTTGLDPQTRRSVWQVISRLQRTEGLTVFLTTHYMEEAAEADHVVILESGSVVAEGTPLELKNRYTGDFILLYGVTEEEVRSLGVPSDRVESIPDGWRIGVAHTKAATDLIVAHPHIFRDYEIVKGRMDDVFLSVTGKTLSEEAGGET